VTEEGGPLRFLRHSLKVYTQNNRVIVDLILLYVGYSKQFFVVLLLSSR